MHHFALLGGYGAEAIHPYLALDALEASSAHPEKAVKNFIKAIGKGAYGVVCSAKNTASGEKVAVKKITNAFENLVDARRTLREMKLLRYLKCVRVL